MKFFPFLPPIIVAAAALPALAGDESRRIDLDFMVDELEYRWQDGDDPLAWSAALSAGTERHRVWLISEGDHTFGDLGGNELRAYYSYTMDSSWNVNVGWRGDVNPDPRQDWFLLGVEGEAPGDIGLGATVYATDGGDSGFRLEVERGFSPARNWFLTPELKANFYGQNTPETGLGSGLSTLELALRLGYEFTPSFATYVGVVWEGAFGTTADYAEAEGEDRSETQFLLGVSISL